MERLGLLLVVTGAVMMTIAAIVERVQWHGGLAPPSGIQRMVNIALVLLGLGALMMGIELVPGG